MDSKTVGMFRSWNHFNEVIIYYQRKTPVFCLLAISVIEVDLVFDSFKKLELISSLRLKARTQQKLEIELVTSITILSLPFLFWRWKVFPARPVRWHPDPSLDHGGPGWSKLTLEKDYNPSFVFQVLSSCPPVRPPCSFDIGYFIFNYNLMVRPYNTLVTTETGWVPGDPSEKVQCYEYSQLRCRAGGRGEDWVCCCVLILQISGLMWPGGPH